MDKANKNLEISKAVVEKIRSKMAGNPSIFFYKILGDILFLLLISYSLLLISEGVMPGLVTAHLSFTKLTLIIFAVLGAIIYIGKSNNLTFELDNKKSALICGLGILVIMLVINSLLKFTPIEIGIITVATVAVIYYLYNSFLKKKV
jgi:hypothetical protein